MRLLKVTKTKRRESDSDEIAQGELFTVEAEDLFHHKSSDGKFANSLPRQTGNRSENIVDVVGEVEEQIEIATAGTFNKRARREGRERRERRDKQASSGAKASSRPEKGSFQDVYNRGVYLLSMREHSRLELEQKLSKKFNAPESLTNVLDTLVDDGYLSDLRFVESFVRSRRLRGHGPSKVRQELVSKGVEDHLIEEYLESDSEEWNELARTVYQKKFGVTVPGDYADWAKRARFLQGRGFNKKHIDHVVPSIS